MKVFIVISLIFLYFYYVWTESKKAEIALWLVNWIKQEQVKKEKELTKFDCNYLYWEWYEFWDIEEMLDWTDNPSKELIEEATQCLKIAWR